MSLYTLSLLLLLIGEAKPRPCLLFRLSSPFTGPQHLHKLVFPALPSCPRSRPGSVPIFVAHTSSSAHAPQPSVFMMAAPSSLSSISREPFSSIPASSTPLVPQSCQNFLLSPASWSNWSEHPVLILSQEF